MTFVGSEFQLPADLPDDVIVAAGGIVHRRHQGEIEIACIYREARGDWTFPKGKLDSGETLEEAALREVLEETNLHCTIENFVGTTNYTHRKGRQKIVVYYLMSVLAGEFEANDEVDELVWLSVDEVMNHLTWDRDQELFATVVASGAFAN